MTPKVMIKQIIAEKTFEKAIEDFGEKNKRNILVVKEFDGRAEIMCSSSIARKLKKRPEFVKELQKLLEDDTETTDDDDYNLVYIPFKDTKRGWNIEVARENATLYLNILGYGIGGSKSLVTRKNKLLRNLRGGTTRIIESTALEKITNMISFYCLLK